MQKQTQSPQLPILALTAHVLKEKLLHLLMSDATLVGATAQRTE